MEEPVNRRLAILLAAAIAVSCQAQPRSSAAAPTKRDAAPRQLKVETLSGGSVITDLGYGIQVNKGSTLQRTFVVINDSGCPVTLQNAGITTKYRGERYSFVPVGSIVASEPITAFQVRYVLYDMYGYPMKTLAGGHVTDIAANTPFPLEETGSWYAWETEVGELLTVGAFVANVRTAGGKIWRFDEKSVGSELARLNLKVSEGSLEPTKEKTAP